MLGTMALPELARMSTSTLEDTFGIGARSAMRVHAAFGLGRIACTASATPKLKIASAKDVAALLGPRLGHLPHEELWLLCLDRAGNLRGLRLVARGGDAQLSVLARDVLRVAVEEGASAIVLVHNHPAGGVEASPADIAFTERIASAAAVVDIPLLDHVIVSPSGFGVVPLPSG
jgi:DNA repair protein RadC